MVVSQDYPYLQVEVTVRSFRKRLKISFDHGNRIVVEP